MQTPASDRKANLCINRSPGMDSIATWKTYVQK